jgi:hypothetical protein
MANTFKLKTEADIGTTESPVYTVPDNTTTVIIGLLTAHRMTGFCSNGSYTTQATCETAEETWTEDTTFSVQIDKFDSTEDSYIIKDAPLPLGSALEVMSGNKIVLETGDILKVTAGHANAVDVSLSIMEMT